MTRRRTTILLAVVALFVGMLPAAAQTRGGQNARPVSGGGNLTAPVDNPDEILHVFIQFTTPSVARFSADRAEVTGVTPARSAQQTQAAAIDQQQAVMRSALSSLMVKELATFRVAANGFRAQVRAGDVAAIRGLPGVKSVTEVILHERDHTASVPWIGAPAAWGGVAGHTGEGITIAIIDSGIDYHHATFGGSGDPEMFATDDGVTDPHNVFPTPKVIGGWDFAGDDYNAQFEETDIPDPDPFPLDCATGGAAGHGTHVAGSAAGFGVNPDGSTYEGPYNEDTFDNDFLVGPGVAPEASLMALRVFGCDGSTGLVGDAIEWAMDPNGDGSHDDAVDVINMSLGSNYGVPDDISAIATDNAVAIGVVVVASAGNAGNNPYITGTPGGAEGAISVAANSAGGVQNVLAIEVHAEDVEPEPAEWQQGETDPEHWASGRGSCDGWEVRNNYNLHPDEEIANTLIRVRNADGTETYVEELPAGEIVAIEDDSEETARTFQWNAIGFGDVTLDLTRDLDDCDDDDPEGHGLEGFYAAVEAAFSAPLWSHGEVTGELAVIDPLIACEPDPDNAGEFLPLVLNAEDIDGKIAVAQRGLCPFAIKYEAAQAAGAVALVVINSEAGAPITMGGDLREGVEAEIPAVMVRIDDGIPLAEAVDDGHTVTITMSADTTMEVPLNPDQIATFTSRGPSRGGSGFKPEITAPGVAITSAAVGSGTRGVAFQGTSMASPHVAGVAALLLNAHPDADPALIKSLIMNSGSPVAPTNTPVSRQGTGMVNVDVAVELGAYTPTAGIAFGRLNPIDAQTYTQTVEVSDLSSGAATFDIDVTPLDGLAGVSVNAQDSVAVDADGTATFDLTLTLDPAVMAEDDAFQSQREAYGKITLTSENDTLTVAYNAVVDPASNVQILDGVDGFGLTNDSDQYSPALAFYQGEAGPGYGLQGFGVGTFGALAAFGIAVEDMWEPMSPVVVDIFIDADQDGVDDYLIRAADQGIIQGAGFNGQYVSATFDLGTGLGAITHFVEADFNDEVMTVIAQMARLSGIDGEFDYYVRVYDVRTGEYQAEQIGTIDFDQTFDGAWFDIEAGDEFDGADFGPLATGGILWLMPNNPVGSQAYVTEPAPPVEDSVGAFDPNTGQWHLRDSAGEETSFYFGAPGDVPLAGDWDGDGVDTVGVYRPSNQTVYLRNSNTTGLAEVTFVIGNAGDIPVAGDWDGDGFDTVSMYRPTSGQVFIFNSLENLVVELEYYFGIPGDKPFAGDFDADGVDTLGLHRESTGLVYFTNGHETAFADNEFFFGNPGDRLIAGDWGIVDLIDTPAVFRPANTTWYFRHTNTIGFADSEFVWGQSHWLPVAGNFGLE